MPLIRVSLPAGCPSEEKRAVADAIYEALRETIGIPEGDRFIALHEHGTDSLFIDRNFMGIERTGRTLLIEITLRGGRTDMQKRALYASTAERLREAAGMRPEDVFIVLHENSSADWSFGGGVAQYLPA